MNQASNSSGVTRTTLLGDSFSNFGSLSSLSNSHLTGNATPSICSKSSLPSIDDHQNYLIYNYKSRDFEHLPIANCEEACIYLCRKLNILPATNLLFGLRSFDQETEWIAPNHSLERSKRYCFRIRFKVASLDTQLRALDPAAYEYLYNQMRYDMVQEFIPEIRYPAKKDNVMGLGVVDMYIDHLEKLYTIEQIESNYKKYLPRELIKAHKLFVKSKICRSFEENVNNNIELDRLKYSYIHEINSLAPNYLTETYTAFADNIPEDEESNSLDAKLQVLIKIDLDDNFDLKICRKTNHNQNLRWFLLAKLEGFYNVSTNGEKLVFLEVKGLRDPYKLEFEKTYEMISFITYLSGYIRLTTDWYMNLSKHYAYPSLNRLKQLCCHGPIGGTFSFAKMREKYNKIGDFLMRQCEKEYDVYYIDINTNISPIHREKCKTETFQIKRDNDKDLWLLVINGSVEPFKNLNDLPQAIPCASPNRFRVKHSTYDKAASLLICLPKKMKTQMMRTEVNEKELQRKRVQVLHPKTDLQWYLNTQQDCDNGKIIKMMADWLQDGKFKDLPVTLKVLKNNNDFSDFMKLIDSWSSIYSPQFLKLYGLTLSTPYTMIMEHAKHGPLNEFLRQYDAKINTLALLNVVHGLVRGITDLQKDEIFHGYIRCSNIYVTKFDLHANILETKIGDPGIQRPYTSEDLPWIPLQYYTNLQNAKNNPSTDYWAFATTIWEIFSRGKSITHLTAEELRAAYNSYSAILPEPKNCPEDMYRTMMDYWSLDLDKPFNQQEIFERLTFIKQSIVPNYESVHTDLEANMVSQSSTTLSSLDDRRSFMENGNDSHPFQTRNYFDHIPSVIRIPGGKVIYKKKIGEGHYGTVYLGEIQYTSNESKEKVAIKTLKSVKCPKLNDDFKREKDIMKSLDHPNIVKIKRWVEKPLSIIMEYVEDGSFIVYLTIQKSNLKNGQLLKFALDIAEGMDYLRSKKIIHRDLAARNILVDSESNCVKISDFGLAQMADSDGYYLAQSIRDIPIKWYSPESIKTGKFSFQHDVWSYGVTLFEMFSRGEDPNLDNNRNLNKEEFLNRLEAGERLKKPSMCPDIVYQKLMLPCWHPNPKARPTFDDLKCEIQVLINDSDDY